MTIKIDIISGFLGAGKTSLIKKFLAEDVFSEKVVLIENEFGEISIDGVIMEDEAIEVKEINNGCICCSLQGDFLLAMEELVERFSPERIIIEPSGVGKLSDVLKAASEYTQKNTNSSINMIITVVDVSKFEIYANNFGDFYKDQLVNARTIVLSRTQNFNKSQLEAIIANIRLINDKAEIVTTPWVDLGAKSIVKVAETSAEKNSSVNIDNLISTEHNHQEKGFAVWATETLHHFPEDKLKGIVKMLEKEKKYGTILRSKGIVQASEKEWLQFDYVPGEMAVKSTKPYHTGKFCIIGTGINKEALKELFLS